MIGIGSMDSKYLRAAPMTLGERAEATGTRHVARETLWRLRGASTVNGMISTSRLADTLCMTPGAVRALISRGRRDGHIIRRAMRDGEAWWNARDVMHYIDHRPMDTQTVVRSTP